MRRGTMGNTQWPRSWLEWLLWGFKTTICPSYSPTTLSQPCVSMMQSSFQRNNQSPVAILARAFT